MNELDPINPINRVGFFDNELQVLHKNNFYDYEGEFDEEGKLCGYGTMHNFFRVKKLRGTLGIFMRLLI